MIEVKDLEVRIGKKTVLNGINFAVPTGSITAILGANGSGKTTLLKTMAGSQAFVKGSISYGKKQIGEFSTSELSVIRAVMSQSNSVEIPFKVREVVMMGRYARFNYKPTPLDEDCVDMAMNTTEVYQFKDRNFSSLSGGEKQRVHLARVLAQIWETKNGYLLLDEPITALDIYHQHQIMELFSVIAAKNFSVVCVLHDLNIAMQYASHALLLNKGSQVTFSTINQALTPSVIAHTFQVKSNQVYLRDQDRFLIYMSGTSDSPGHKAKTV
jgi:iron complex transport system ATP-binding protein